MKKEIEEMNRKVKSCRKCRLCETRKNALHGEGNVDSKLMIVAQAPGENEDREGKMFIGPSGKKLHELFERVGINGREIYMTNLLKCMLPKYRKPKQDEIEACSQYLNKEIDLINPVIISPLGYHPTKYILQKYGISMPGSKSEFLAVYGKVFQAENKKILPLAHPATLLYNDSIWEEMTENYKKMKLLLESL